MDGAEPHRCLALRVRKTARLLTWTRTDCATLLRWLTSTLSPTAMLPAHTRGPIFRRIIHFSGTCGSVSQPFHAQVRGQSCLRGKCHLKRFLHADGPPVGSTFKLIDPAGRRNSKNVSICSIIKPDRPLEANPSTFLLPRRYHEPSLQGSPAIWKTLRKPSTYLATQRAAAQWRLPAWIRIDDQLVLEDSRYHRHYQHTGRDV